MNMRFVSAVCVVLAAACALGETYYVSPTGDGSAPTAGFATGYAYLDDALKAVPAGSTVVMDRGTIGFRTGGDITLTKQLTLTGVGTREETIVDGDTKKPRISIQAGAEKTVFKNFTFMRFGDPNANSYMGIEMQVVSLMTNLVACLNGHGTLGTDPRGYGVFYARNATVSGCVVTNNVCPGGAVVYLRDSNLENCYIAGNEDGGRGSSPGIVHAYKLNILVRNCTIVDNRSDAGAVYHSYYRDSIIVVNNIVWGNVGLNSSTVHNYGGSADCRGRWMTNCVEEASTLTGIGNFPDDPLLASDRLHLMSKSPCIGRADPGRAPAIDIDGNPRGDTPSVGCAEPVSGGFSCVVSPSADVVYQPATITCRAVIDGDAKLPLTYAWDKDGDGKADSSDDELVLSDIGVYRVSVVVTDADRKACRASSSKPLVIYGHAGNVYVTNAVNPKARAPYATWETAADSLALAMPYGRADAKIVLSDGLHLITNKISITDALTVSSAHGRDFTLLKREYVSLPQEVRSFRMFEIDNAGAVLEGVTITNSTCRIWNHGTVALLHAGTIRDSSFAGCQTAGMGMVSVDNDGKETGSILRCVFAGNIMDDSQGPVCVSLARKSSSLVENCLFVGNKAIGTSLAPTVDSSYYGAALNSQSGSAVIRNCTFADNACQVGMPLHFDADPAEFRNNIVVGGTTNDGACAANDLINWKTGAVIASITNACVWPAAMDYSDKPGVLTADPLFRDRAAGDCHLVGPSSPCWNAGDKTGIGKGAVDLDGLPRIRRGRVDLGCYEDQTVLGLMMIVK